MRKRLTRSGIVEAAVRVADGGGLPAVSMRNVGRELGVEAMSLYNHVASKDDLLDALADWIFAGIDLPPTDLPWRTWMVARCDSARQTLSQHPWALVLVESRRSPGPALLRHHDGVLACLRREGFPIALAAHAYSVVDAYVYGFVLTEVSLPFAPGESAEEFVHEVNPSAEAYPHLTELMNELVIGKDYDFADEFGYGLDLILDQLDNRLRQHRSTT